MPGGRLNVIAALALLAGPACTDVPLYGRAGQEPYLANKVGLSGVLCTDNPASRKFPVKILFLVDSSGEMREAAPLGEHVTVIEQALSQHLPIPNVWVGIIRYDDRATSLVREQAGRVVSGFTRDDAQLDAALANLRNAAGARDLPGALSLARSIVTGDAFQADRGPLSRTKYVLVHVTSGSPSPPVTAARCESVFDAAPPVCELAFLEKEVQDLRDQVLALGAAELSFHTIHLEAPHFEGAPCDPREGAAPCGGGARVTCVQTGARVDTGRCVQLCDPSAPVCDAFPGRTLCARARLPDATEIDHCARGELACFDGADNDGDGLDRDCSDPDYPYGCSGQNRCEDDCRSTCRAARLGLALSLGAAGRYERFESADRLSFGRIDLRSTQRLFVLKEFLAFNRNALPRGEGFLPDTDADGLPDAEEETLGLNPRASDGDQDGFGDRTEHLLRTLGFDPTVPNVVPDCEDPLSDTDGDGLGDCEEKLLGTDRTLFDTDADGFPDGVEQRLGTNPLFGDALEDLDLDGVANGREIEAHTDPGSNDARARAELAYRYRTLDLGVTEDQRSCYDFRVHNITLVDTLDRGFGPGNNDIDVFFGQVPDGSLEGFGVFHVAQVRVQYLPPDRRIPDTPVIDLEESDFVIFEQ